MGKIVECAKVDPASGCTHVVLGNTDEEVLQNTTRDSGGHAGAPGYSEGSNPR